MTTNQVKLHRFDVSMHPKVGVQIRGASKSGKKTAAVSIVKEWNPDAVIVMTNTTEHETYWKAISTHVVVVQSFDCIALPMLTVADLIGGGNRVALIVDGIDSSWIQALKSHLNFKCDKGVGAQYAIVCINRTDEFFPTICLHVGCFAPSC